MERLAQAWQIVRPYMFKHYRSYHWLYMKEYWAALKATLVWQISAWFGIRQFSFCFLLCGTLSVPKNIPPNPNTHCCAKNKHQTNIVPYKLYTTMGLSQPKLCFGNTLRNATNSMERSQQTAQHININTCMHTSMHAYIHIHANMRTSMHTYMHEK